MSLDAELRDLARVPEARSRWRAVMLRAGRGDELEPEEGDFVEVEEATKTTDGLPLLTHRRGPTWRGTVTKFDPREWPRELPPRGIPYRELGVDTKPLYVLDRVTILRCHP